MRMRLVRPTWLLCVAAGTVAMTSPLSTGAQSRLPAAHERALTDTLAGFVRRMGELLARRDADGATALYGRPQTLVHIENGVIIPWRELEPQMRQYLTTVSSNPVSIVGDPRVIVLGRDVAVVWAVHRFAGNATVPRHDGVWTAVLERREGRWRIVHSHGSDVPAQKTR